MTYNSVGENVYVVLSVRNVQQLLEAYDRGYTAGIVRTVAGQGRLHVRVESDADHYQNREPGPGLEKVILAGTATEPRV